jgi:hypothetical protein
MMDVFSGSMRSCGFKSMQQVIVPIDERWA